MKFSNLLLYLILSGLIASCATPKRNLSQLDLENGFDGYMIEYQNELTAISTKSVERLKQEHLQLSVSSQSYDILVLSGGGALGAFGAGFLKGWGKIENSDFARPVFDSVSGISTGALIAPFAFVGTKKSYDDLLQLYRNPDQDWIVARGILSFLFGDRAYYDATKLHQRIRRSITLDLLNALAEGSKENRSLLVGATNLDYGMMRVWDLSLIAARLNEADATEEITNRLVASSAIPAVFPPVNIDNFLYVDGGASMQVVSGLDNRDWLYQGQSSVLQFLDPAGPPLRIRIWIVINNKLLMEPEITSASWSTIAVRSLDSLMRASTLQTLQDIETYSQMINSRPEFEVQMLYVAIPQAYEIPETENLFDVQKMRDLADLGEQMGANPEIWKQRAVRPGAPITEDGKQN